MTIINLAAYQFQMIPRKTLPDLKNKIKQHCDALDMRGLILLSHEGINLMVAGDATATDDFKQYMSKQTPFSHLYFKESFSQDKPFRKMLVKIKAFSIPFADLPVNPSKKTAPYLTPEALKSWFEQKKPFILLDTRNDYEVRLGTFDNAIHFHLKKFTDFPTALLKHKKQNKDEHLPVVTFCTGGIRCEKAATWMQTQGYDNVYQLEGGILEYFKKCGSEHYHGECFVFDKRVGIDAHLQETQTIQCYACRNPLTLSQQENLQDQACPYCHSKVTHAKTREKCSASLLRDNV